MILGFPVPAHPTSPAPRGAGLGAGLRGASRAVCPADAQQAGAASRLSPPQPWEPRTVFTSRSTILLIVFPPLERGEATPGWEASSAPRPTQEGRDDHKRGKKLEPLRPEGTDTAGGRARRGRPTRPPAKPGRDHGSAGGGRAAGSSRRRWLGVGSLLPREMTGRRASDRDARP